MKYMIATLVTVQLLMAQWAAAAPAPDAPVPLAGIKVPDGLAITLWAQSPMLMNPTNMDTDAAGRIWVAEGVNYRKGKNNQPEGDRIMVLTDSDHDGRADESHVFVQEPGLISPLGVSVFDNKIVVSQPPDLIVYTDVDRNQKFDPKVDKREVLLTGFNGSNHDHSLHSVVAGPDGMWYINQGNTGAKFTDNDGNTWVSGGPYDAAAAYAGMRSSDGFLYSGGFTARMDETGRRVEIIGCGYRNSYEDVVNSFGEMFQNDNDDPPACRNSYVMEYGNAGYFSRDGKRKWGSEIRAGQTVQIAHWHQEDPGFMPVGDVYGRGSPTGVDFYENGALPEAYNGLFLAAEAKQQVIFGIYPKANGAGYDMTHFEFQAMNREAVSQDAQALLDRFRISDVMVGVDGALYLADWYDEQVGGHGTRDGSFTGAIYRIAPTDFRPVVPGIDCTTTAGQILALRSPAKNVRYAGFQGLKSQGAAALPAIQHLLEDPNPWIAARGIWLLPYLGPEGIARANTLLADGNPTSRRIAFQVLRRAGQDMLRPAQILAKDSSPMVRRDVATSLRKIPAADKIDILRELALQWDGTDRTYLEAVGIGAAGAEAALFQAIFNTENPASPEVWSATLARWAWRLQPIAHLPALKARATAAALPQEARDLAWATIAFTRAPEAAQACVDLFRTAPELRSTILPWANNRFGGGEWEGYIKRDILEEAGLLTKILPLQDVRIPNAPRKRTVPTIEQVAALTGDAVKGKQQAARCLMCHRFDGQGIDFGPGLDGWARAASIDTILRAIVDPGDTIALGFDTYEISLQDHKTKIQGLLVSEDENGVTLKSYGGLVQRIDYFKARNKARRIPASMMYYPEAMGLTEAQDFADLIAYLKSL